MSKEGTEQLMSAEEFYQNSHDPANIDLVWAKESYSRLSRAQREQLITTVIARVHKVSNEIIPSLTNEKITAELKADKKLLTDLQHQYDNLVHETQALALKMPTIVQEMSLAQWQDMFEKMNVIKSMSLKSHELNTKILAIKKLPADKQEAAVIALINLS